MRTLGRIRGRSVPADKSAAKTDSYIKQSFELCGLNPYAPDDTVFEKHLASLGENLVYAALTAVHTALTLEN